MARPVRTFVIEEDEHLQNLRKIIKRDFFGSATAQEEAQTVKMNLNGYISNYKSTQNHFFSQMVNVNSQEWKEKHWWIDRQEKMLMVTAEQKFKALPYHNMLEKNIEINGIDTSIVKQDAKNSLFFNRDVNYGSLQSKQYEEGKKVLYRNCKFDDKISKVRAQLAIKREEETPLRQGEVRGKMMDDDVSETPLPQGTDGHMMTWGQIESTPLRLSGKQFHMPETPQRQQLLHEMNIKLKKQKFNPARKSDYAMKILGSLTPSFNSSKRVASSIRRVDSVKRENNSGKSDLSGLLNIKKQ